MRRREFIALLGGAGAAGGKRGPYKKRVAA
jgi:hypothetical protein